MLKINNQEEIIKYKKTEGNFCQQDSLPKQIEKLNYLENVLTGDGKMWQPYPKGYWNS